MPLALLPMWLLLCHILGYLPFLSYKPGDAPLGIGGRSAAARTVFDYGVEARELPPPSPAPPADALDDLAAWWWHMINGVLLLGIIGLLFASESCSQSHVSKAALVAPDLEGVLLLAASEFCQRSISVVLPRPSAHVCLW